MAKNIAGTPVPLVSTDTDDRPILRQAHRPNFLFAVHRDAWEFVIKSDGSGAWVPKLLTMWLQPGVNGLQTQGGRPGARLKHLRSYMANHEEVDGRIVLHPEAVGGYVTQAQIIEKLGRRVMRGVTHYMAFWTTLEKHDDNVAEEVVDHDARIAWLEDLVRGGKVPLPRPSVKRDAIALYEQTIRRNRSRKSPRVEHIQKLEAELQAMRGTPLPKKQTATKPKRATTKRKVASKPAPLEADDE